MAMMRSNQPTQLMRTHETQALSIRDGRYEKKQKCPACNLTQKDRNRMKYETDYDPYVDPPPRCPTCADGDRLGRQVTPPRGPGVVCDDEGTCSVLPQSVRRFFGLARGTRKPYGSKKRHGKKHSTKKRHSKKSSTKKRHRSKKQGKSRKNYRGGKNCSTHLRKKIR